MFAAVFIDRGVAVKISFRSVGKFSVSDFSRRHFDGGGHHNAAGGISYDKLDATLERFLGILPEYKEQLTGVPAAVAPPVA